MRSLVMLLALSGLLAPLAPAAAPPAPSVARLIEQLGGDERAAALARARLSAMDEDVLPLLRKAASTHADPDVRLRAVVIVAAIEESYLKPVHVFSGHTDGVSAFALSPDGKRMVSSAWCGTADHLGRVWDLATGKELMQLEGHTSNPGDVAWSPDGKHILTGGNDGKLFLWDATSGKLSKRVDNNRVGGICGVALSPDGKFAVTASCSDRTASVWDVEACKRIATNADSPEHLRRVAMMPDGKHFVTTSYDGAVRVIEVETGKLVRTLDGKHDQAWIALSADGKRIARTGSDHRIAKVHEVATGELVNKFQADAEGVQVAALSRDGKRLLTAGADNAVSVWDVASGKRLQRIEYAHTTAITCAAFAADGRHAVTGSYDKKLKLWKVRK